MADYLRDLKTIAHVADRSAMELFNAE